MNKLRSLADVLERTVFDMKEHTDIQSKLRRINSDREHFSLVDDCLCLVWDFKKDIYSSVHFIPPNLSLSLSYPFTLLVLFLFPREQFVLEFIPMAEIFLLFVFLSYLDVG